MTRGASTGASFVPYVTKAGDGHFAINLLVEGMRCASCAWRIESTLNQQPDVKARVNFSTQRLSLDWGGAPARVDALTAKVAELGFKTLPFSEAVMENKEEAEARFLLRCMAVSGFAAGNLMLLSLALWFSGAHEMGEGTRGLMHWLSALVALPAIAYSGLPFFRSALGALKSGHANMDVPISLAVILAAVMSLSETVRHGPYVYFDASVMLLFFLLIGRYLDRKMRGRARVVAGNLLAMLEGNATVERDGRMETVLIRELEPGMVLQVAVGEKIAADGVVESGVSEIDASLLTGETVPQNVAPGARVFAGMVNLGAPLKVKVGAASEQSLLADIVRLMETAEQGQARYRRLADRMAAIYTPTVHVLALGTFAGWMLMGMAWQPALMVATTVLIITCPCALGLAVPAVQVVATGRLFRQGMLVKSGDALERLAAVDSVVFDKTGTLTEGRPVLANGAEIPPDKLQLAATLAAQSRHPLAQAVAAAYQGPLLPDPLTVAEVPGCGLESEVNGARLRLGRRDWCEGPATRDDDLPELWLKTPAGPPVRFVFRDPPRADSRETVLTFREAGMAMSLLSGDRAVVAEALAKQVGIAEVQAPISPVGKAEAVQKMVAAGKKVLMVGDGLNDAPALQAATVSVSPSSAVDITQNAADIVFQGEKLGSVVEAWKVARLSVRLIRQNFALSLLYNALAVPLAIFGYVTPLVAAVAMSSSSLVVVLNALRLGKMRG